MGRFVGGLVKGRPILTFAEAFGDSEYEYFYHFDRENTDHLFRLLAPEGQDVRNVLKRRLCGMDGCQALREFCEGNGIKYGFFSC